MLNAWSHFVARRAGLVLSVGLVVVAAAAVFGVGVFGALSNGGFDNPKSESGRAFADEQAHFESHDADVIAIYASDDLTVDSPAFKQAVDSTIAGYPTDAVARVVSYYDTPAPGLVSDDHHQA